MDWIKKKIIKIISFIILIIIFFSVLDNQDTKVLFNSFSSQVNNIKKLLSKTQQVQKVNDIDFIFKSELKDKLSSGYQIIDMNDYNLTQKRYFKYEDIIYIKFKDIDFQNRLNFLNKQNKYIYYLNNKKDSDTLKDIFRRLKFKNILQLLD